MVEIVLEVCIQRSCKYTPCSFKTYNLIRKTNLRSYMTTGKSRPKKFRTQRWRTLEENELGPTWLHTVSAHCMINKSY